MAFRKTIFSIITSFYQFSACGAGLGCTNSGGDMYNSARIPKPEIDTLLLYAHTKSNQ